MSFYLFQFTSMYINFIFGSDKNLVTCSFRINFYFFWNVQWIENLFIVKVEFESHSFFRITFLAFIVLLILIFWKETKFHGKLIKLDVVCLIFCSRNCNFILTNKRMLCQSESDGALTLRYTVANMGKILWLKFNVSLTRCLKPFLPIVKFI